MNLPRISALWSPVHASDYPMHFVEVLGFYEGKYGFHVLVWTESGYASVVNV